MMYNELSTLGISIDKVKRNLFTDFSEYFIEYNKNVNLISKNDISFLFEKHIFDSLAINLFFQKYNINSSAKILDIGTGGGFPSLPCSIIFDNMSFYCIDSINKKINFIKSAADKFSIKNIFPVCARVEELNDDNKNSYDIVVSRAMAELRKILEYSIPYVKTGGYFIAYKSIKAEIEIKDAQNALKILNAELIDLIDYVLPLKDNNKRVLLIIKKKRETSPIYPRQCSLISKKPL